jgi:hypothetical protein
MVRNHKTFAAKDSICPLAEEDFSGWMYQVALCGKAAAGNMPVQGAWYKMLERCGSPPGRRSIKIVGGLAFGAKGLSASFSTPSDSCRVSYWKAFGIEPGAQLLYEQSFTQSQIRIH